MPELVIRTSDITGTHEHHFRLRNPKGLGSGIDTDAPLDQILPIGNLKNQIIQLLGIFLKLSTRCSSKFTGVFIYL